MTKMTTKIRVIRVYEMELSNPQNLTEQEARELFREEEHEMDFLQNESVELIGFTLEELQKMKTLAVGQAADLKFDNGEVRVWLSRCTVADGVRQPCDC